MPELVKEVPDLVYVIVGDGPERANLEHLTEDLKIGRHVLFIGSCAPERLVQFYNVCDLFILLSKTLPLIGTQEYRAEDLEGFGITFTEAGACGKPVVGGNSGGIPDAIVNGETGYLVDPDNLQEIKEAILGLLLNPEKAKEMGENGRRRVIDELSWQKVTKQFDSRLETLLAPRQQHSTNDGLVE